MTSETETDRPKTSRGRRHYEGVSSTSTDYGNSFSQYTGDAVEHNEPAYTPIPRPKSSRQRPKSGYKVRRQQPEAVQPDMYSDNYHLYERSSSSAHYTDGITAAAAKFHSDSPRTSYDSGVYEQPVDRLAPTPSPRPSSRHGSARPRTKQGQRTGNLNQTPEPDWRPTSSARPESASSFSRYTVLPDIGTVSSSDTPEPAFVGQPLGYTHHEPSSRSSPQTDTQAFQKEIIRERSFVGRKYKDIHENFDRKMKELSMNDNIDTKQVDSIQRDQTTDSHKSAIIHIPFEETPAGGAGLTTENSPAKDSSHSTTGVTQGEAEDYLVLTFPALQRKVVLPEEPKEGEPRLLLAVKLPNGQRAQRHFRTSDQLLHVLRFAEHCAQLDFTNCEVVCDAPRKVFKDLSIKLQNSGLESRTVVHIQIPDD